MHAIFQKVLALMGFIKRITPMIDDSVDDVTKVFSDTERRLEVLKKKKALMRLKIAETQDQLQKEWDAAMETEIKAENVQSKIKEIIG